LPAGGTLLFPSHRYRVERPYTQLRAFATVLTQAQIEKPVTLHTLRHTYCSARLQTLDGGASVSVWDVAVELGHRDTEMIERVYGHVLQDRTRHSPRRADVRYETAPVLPLARANA